MMNLIDTHCHIYGEEFDRDLPAIIERAENEGVEKFYLPGIDSSVIDRMLKTEQQFPGKCLAMMGLHPCSVKEDYRQELAVVAEWLDRRRFAAVGEIGLDFYWDKTFSDQQYDAFRQQLELAKQHKLPAVLHCRDSLDESIGVVKSLQDGRLSGIFHCFGGTPEQARQITDLGFYLGIGGIITYKNSGLGPVIEQTSLDHIVLETDAPYLSPVPFRGKRNESSYLKYVVQKLAELKQAPVEEVAAITTRNAQKIFGA
jgi:TatD DNase family protein